MPDVLSKLIYPIDKSQLALVRLVHFLALAVVVSRLTPPDWHSLMNAWMMAMIRCGENSLAIQQFRHACRCQHCRDRPDGRGGDPDDLDSHARPARAKAILRSPIFRSIGPCDRPRMRVSFSLRAIVNCMSIACHERQPNLCTHYPF